MAKQTQRKVRSAIRGLSKAPIEQRTPIPHRAPFRATRQEMAVHENGWTALGLRPRHTHAEIDQWAWEMGFPFPSGWQSLTVVVKIDFVATWVIACSYDRSFHHPYVLSPYQFWTRAVVREIPMDHADMSNLVALADRCQYYIGGISGRGGDTMSNTVIDRREAVDRLARAVPVRGSDARGGQGFQTPLTGQEYPEPDVDAQDRDERWELGWD